MLRHFSFGGNYKEEIFTPHLSKMVLRKSTRRHQPTHLAFMSHIPYSRVNIDWTCVTHLHLANMSRLLAFRAMKHTSKFTSITHIFLSNINDSYGERIEDWMPPPSTIIHMSTVTSLSIEENDAFLPVSQVVYNHFKMPNLSHLQCDGSMSCKAFLIASFIAFVQRSACSITDFAHIKPVLHYNEDPDVLDLMRVLPMLQSLKLDLQMTDNRHTTFFGQLSQQRMRKEGAQLFLPSLAHLDTTAVAPNDWLALIGIFDDSPSIPGPPWESPLRKGLKITFSILLDGDDKSRNNVLHERFIEKLIHLWRSYGVFVVFKLAKQFAVLNFLMVSYCSPYGESHPAEDLDEDTLDAVIELSTLSF